MQIMQCYCVMGHGVISIKIKKKKYLHIYMHTYKHTYIHIHLYSKGFTWVKIVTFFLMFNYAICYESVWSTEGTNSRILNVCSRWRWIVRLIPRLLKIRRTCRDNHWVQGGGTPVLLIRFWKDKNFSFAQHRIPAARSSSA
jgi:hypothetical protein